MKLFWCLMLLMSTLCAARGDVYVSYSSDNSFKVLQPNMTVVSNDANTRTVDISVDNSEGAWYHVSVLTVGNGVGGSGLPQGFMLAPHESGHYVGRVHFNPGDSLSLRADGTFNEPSVVLYEALDVALRATTGSSMPVTMDDYFAQRLSQELGAAGTIYGLEGALQGKAIADVVNGIAKLATDDVVRANFLMVFGKELPEKSVFATLGFWLRAYALIDFGDGGLVAAYLDAQWDIVTFDAIRIGGPPGSSPGGTPGTVVNNNNAAMYIKDLNYPDGFQLLPLQPFTKSWMIRNTGNVSWGPGYRWVFVGGSKMGGPDFITVPNVPPGATWNPSIALTSPGTAEKYRGFWQMQDPDGNRFGTQVWVEIQVAGGESVTTFVSETALAPYDGAPGFRRFGTPQYWHDATDAGDSGHMYWTLNNDAAHGVDNYGEWRPNLPDARYYEVQVFIPHNHGTTQQAHYTVSHADGVADVYVNQLNYNDEWVSLGTYHFLQGSQNYLRLVDMTGEAYISRQVGFDAARWLIQSDSPGPSLATVFVSESDMASQEGAPGFWQWGTSSYWRTATNVGDGGRMKWTWNNGNKGIDNMGDWRPNLPANGRYELSVFIPSNHAYTKQARYEIYHADGRTDVQIDQSIYFDQWVSLGTYRFLQGSQNCLRLIDYNDEAYATTQIGFDTVKWEQRAGETYAPVDLAPREDAIVNSDMIFAWHDSGMNDGNPSANFQIQVWRVVNNEREERIWDSDWRTGTSREWSAPGPGEYEWVVQAGNGINQSTASQPARFIVPVPAPSTPSNLAGTATSPTSIKLTWQDNSKDEDAFKIERRQADGTFVQIATIDANVITYTDTAVQASTTYTYRVRATNTGGDSDYSNNADVSTPSVNPVFSSSVMASPSTVVSGATITLLVSVNNAGGPLTGAVVDVEIYDTAGKQVWQQIADGQDFTTNQTRNYTYSWTPPAGTATYTVKVGVFGAHFTSLYHWNDRAASVYVEAGNSLQYTFEDGTQGWGNTGGMITSIASSTAMAYEGTHSLAVNINTASADTQQVFVASPAVTAGKTITFHIWIPQGSSIKAVQPYVLQGASGNWKWTGTWQDVSSLTVGGWNTIMVTVPPDAVTPLAQIGVQFITNGQWSGTCYVDAVGW